VAHYSVFILTCVPFAFDFPPFSTSPSDFGLATELKESKKVSDDLYKMTEMTGSPIYMAPEGKKQVIEHRHDGP
jgi:hypothetical protein